MPVLDLTIDDIGAQGDGIAHVGNAAVFVSGALTGERVRVNLEESKNLVKRAELIEILVPSSLRVQPPCPHFPLCGGCRFQHLNDETYTSFKLGQLQQTLLREKIDLPPFMAPVITAPETRRRARIAVEKKNKDTLIGFNEWRSHSIVDLQSCPVMRSEIVALIGMLRPFLSTYLRTGEKCDFQLTSLPDGMDVVIIGGPSLDITKRQFLAEMAQKLKITHLSWKKWDRAPTEPLVHLGPLGVTFGKTRVPFPPGSFLQATETGEQALIDFVKSAQKTGDRVLDLFCGLGTFGLSLDDPKSVHFADLDGPAVTALEHEVRKGGRFEVSLRNLTGDPFSIEELKAYDLVIFDPPRGGARAQAAQLAQSKVKTIIAVSCDPPSFAKDAKILIEGGYKLQSILPIDQFLWSPHLECAAKFTKM